MDFYWLFIRDINICVFIKIIHDGKKEISEKRMMKRMQQALK